MDTSSEFIPSCLAMIRACIRRHFYLSQQLYIKRLKEISQVLKRVLFKFVVQKRCRTLTRVIKTTRGNTYLHETLIKFWCRSFENIWEYEPRLCSKLFVVLCSRQVTTATVQSLQWPGLCQDYQERHSKGGGVWVSLEQGTWTHSPLRSPSPPRTPRHQRPVGGRVRREYVTRTVLLTTNTLLLPLCW